MLRRIIIVTVFALVVPFGQASAQGDAQPGIRWRLENPFRLFTDPKTTELHRLAFEDLTPGERLTPILSIERRLAAVYPRGWAAEVIDKVCWQDALHRYGCKAREDYINPKSHRVLVSIPPGEWSTTRCSWTMTPLETKNSTPQRVIAPCREEAAFDVPYPAGARIVLEASGFTAETTIKVRDVFIVGMGDSFASGEGNPDVPVEFSREREVAYGTWPGGDLNGYPARLGAWSDVGDRRFLDYNPRWLNQPCHRSLYSHQLRVALQLALEDPQRAITFVSFACAGAEVSFGLLIRYKGTEWAPNPPDRPQVGAAVITQCNNEIPPEEKYPVAFSINGQLPELADIPLARCPPDKARPIDLVLLSIGGNDIGFASLVANAVLSNKGRLRQLGGWMGTVIEAADAEARLPQLELRYKALNRALHGNLHIPWNESDRIILSAYPVMASAADGKSICRSGTEGMNVFPEFKLDAKRAEAGEKVGEKLTRTMRKSAAALGWTFSEAHRAQFAGRGICVGNGNDPTDGMMFPRKQNGRWHPFNPADYRPYAPRERWYRTPNDAFLTGNFHIAGSIAKQVFSYESVQWLQLVLASTYSGAFHPTAEGQAAMADGVLADARAVLNKYSGKSRVVRRHTTAGPR
jgi:lysophospholipase L1-like esterase